MELLGRGADDCQAKALAPNIPVPVVVLFGPLRRGNGRREQELNNLPAPPTPPLPLKNLSGRYIVGLHALTTNSKYPAHQPTCTYSTWMTAQLVEKTSAILLSNRYRYSTFLGANILSNSRNHGGTQPLPGFIFGLWLIAPISASCMCIEPSTHASVFSLSSRIGALPAHPNTGTLHNTIASSNTLHCNRVFSLSQEQEKHLADWVLAQAALGLPPTHYQVKEFAGRIVKAGGDTRPLRKQWISGFLARNPEISTIKGRSLDSARVNGASVARIEEWFQLLKLPAIQAIPPESRFNIDETGILEGLGSNSLVLGSSEKRETLKKRLGSRCWTTIVECVSAIGQALTPLFPDELDFLRDWDFIASLKG
ncbi:Tc5 transposase DNA-binding domain-containing protein [Hirsutella rhossiliensis]